MGFSELFVNFPKWKIINYSGELKLKERRFMIY